MKYRFSSLKRTLRRVWRTITRVFHRKPFYVVGVLVFVVAAAGILYSTMTKIDANYTELLSTIAEGESKGNYNAYFGNANNTEIDFTTMTVAEVLAWQQQYVAEGHVSSAVGKYQFINTTLRGLVREMQIDEAALFDPALQDRLAIRLLERRGAQDYLRGRISREQFAHNLSQEWAALPRVTGNNPAASYYADDGLNKAQLSVDEVLVAIASLQNDRKS